MSVILESSAVITVQKTFNQLTKFYDLCSSAKNAAGGVSQSDLNKLHDYIAVC